MSAELDNLQPRYYQNSPHQHAATDCQYQQLAAATSKHSSQGVEGWDCGFNPTTLNPALQRADDTVAGHTRGPNTSTGWSSKLQQNQGNQGASTKPGYDTDCIAYWVDCIGGASSTEKHIPIGSRTVHAHSCRWATSISTLSPTKQCQSFGGTRIDSTRRSALCKALHSAQHIAIRFALCSAHRPAVTACSASNTALPSFGHGAAASVTSSTPWGTCRI